MRVRVEMLGSFRLIVDGTEVHVQRVQVQRAIALLVALGPQPVSQDQLVEHLWGVSLPADPKASLRVALSRVRSALGEARSCLQSDVNGYSLVAGSDIADYEAELDRAVDAAEDTLAIESWTRADELWSDAFAAFTGNDALIGVEGHLRRRRADSIPAHADCLIRLSRYADALAVGTPAQRQNPGDERLARSCALALVALGRRTSAIELLSQTRQYLRDNLGLSPTDALVEVENRILRASVNLESQDGQASTPTSTVFVGRYAEVEALVASDPGLHVVSGEPGSGKSALLMAVGRELERLGRTVLWTHALQTPTRPVEPIAGLLVELAKRIPPADHTDGLCAALARLAPDFATGTGAAPTSRDGLLTLAREAIEDFAASETVVILLEDAQWLDRSSLQVFEALTESSSITAIASCRTAMPEHVSLLFEDPRRARTISIGPMTRSEIAELVAIQLPSLAVDETVNTLLGKSGGNALFLTLLIELISEGGSSHASLPPNILVSVQERIQGLPPSAQRTLEAASVFTDSIPIKVLSDLVAGAEVAIDAAVSDGLVVETTVHGRYRFTHSLVADAIYQLLADGSRLELHDEVGRLLEAHGAAAAEFALHCSEAAVLDPLRSVTSHLAAAHEFAASFDWDNALLHTERGLNSQADYQLDPSSTYADLLVVAGTAMRGQGQTEGDSLLISGVEVALDHHALDLAVAGLLALCTHGRMATSEGDQILELVERTLDSSGLSTAQQAQLLSCEATLVAISPLQDRGRASHRRAFELLEVVDDVGAQRDVLLRTHLGFPHIADFPSRVRATEMLATLADNDPDLLWEVAFLSFGSAMVRGADSEAEAQLQRMRDLAPRIRRRQRDYGLRFSEAAWARYCGDLEHAEALLGSALEIGQQTYGDEWTLFVYAAVMSSIREAQGRLHELLPLVDGWMAADPEWPTWHVVAAGCAASMADDDRVRQELAWLKRDSFACLSPDMSWPAAFSFLSEPVRLVEDVEAAQVLLALIEPYAGLNLWNGACIHRPVDDVVATYQAVLASR